MFRPKTSPAADRRERKRRIAQDHLAETAFHLFETHGYQAVTMERIATVADVAKATLYKYFPVKEALLAHRFHGELAAEAPELLARIRSLPRFRDRITHVLRESADWSERKRPYLGAYLRYRFATVSFHEEEPPSDQDRSGMGRLLEVLIIQGQKDGDLRTDIPAWSLAWSLEFLYLGALTRWLGQPANDLTNAFDQLLTLFLDGAEMERRP
ncbi:MAG: TetR/AcrR family transcriptional regulator [Rhodospirillum sp.]|nr:TetR/AcrR family transcriptional regulator [Rhodospirillum sp.]MCF8488493.1 TetR/AcrR family transcriptional regulator [Rhodospirillum sp.]